MNKFAQSNAREILAAYVANLRSIYLVHQNNHWQCSGPNFYANHLLFERLYKEAGDQADMLAEKAIGLFGSETLDLRKQASLIKTLTSMYTGGGPEDCVKSSLKAEQDFVRLSGTIKAKLTDLGVITLGLDDLIMELASKSEGRIYLLQQAMA